MADIEDKFNEFLGKHAQDLEYAEAWRCACMAASVTALSFLVAEGHATVEQVTQRLQLAQNELPEKCRTADVARYTNDLAQTLSRVCARL